MLQQDRCLATTQIWNSRCLSLPTHPCRIEYKLFSVRRPPQMTLLHIHSVASAAPGCHAHPQASGTELPQYFVQDVPPSPAVRAKARSPSPAAATTSSAQRSLQSCTQSTCRHRILEAPLQLRHNKVGDRKRPVDAKHGLTV